MRAPQVNVRLAIARSGQGLGRAFVFGETECPSTQIVAQLNNEVTFPDEVEAMSIFSLSRDLIQDYARYGQSFLNISD